MPVFSCFSTTTVDSTTKLKRNILGPLRNVSEVERQWYADAVVHYKTSTDYVFKPMPHTRIGIQPFCAWRVMLDMTNKWKKLKKRKIYLLQVGPMPDFIANFTYNHRNFWEFLAVCLQIYFPGVLVEILQPSTDFFEKNAIKSRHHSVTNREQYLISDVKDNLVLPSDGMCLLALSWTDLYPSEELNFVLGEANFQMNIGVFCFGRFEPKLVEKTGRCDDVTELNGDVIYRLIRVISHETCHLLGINHCLYFHCAMNESDSLELALSQPLLCCPFCVRKIQHVLSFSLEDYYRSLDRFCHEMHDAFPSKYWLKDDHASKILQQFHHLRICESSR